MEEVYEGTVGPKRKPDEHTETPPAQHAGTDWQSATVLPTYTPGNIPVTYSSRRMDKVMAVDICQFGMDYEPLHMELDERYIPDGVGHIDLIETGHDPHSGESGHKY